jgi:putative endonuclease
LNEDDRRIQQLARRQRAERHGHGAEWFAALALMLKGYRIIDRRFRTRAGEIDLVVRRGAIVAFVEVKARHDTRAAVDSVSATTQHRIRAASDFWIARASGRDARVASWSYRYDIVAVSRRHWPRHFPDAF